MGAIGTVAWLACFVAKLFALARAMRLQLSRSAKIVAILGAVGMACVPWMLRALDGRAGRA